MVRFVKGDVVVIPFPYSDLSAAKTRPALVVAPLDGSFDPAKEPIAVPVRIAPTLMKVPIIV